MLALTKGAAGDRAHLVVLECVCFSICAFPQLYTHFGFRCGRCLRPRSFGSPGMRALTSMLALTRGAVCDRAHSVVMGCVCFNNKLFLQIY